LQLVLKLNELSEGKGKRFMVGDEDIAVFLIDGQVYALSNICPHQQSAIIYEGCIEENFVVCPAHGWKFNLENGKKENRYNGLKSYPVKLDGDIVTIEVEQKSLNWKL
jgi:nitrite reductase/ring-hydroxylating ferredoxin subunit